MPNEKSLTGNAVVVGAGVMGAGIASLLANVGWRVSLLDRVPDGAASGDVKARNRLAQEGLDRAIRARPPQLALPEYASRIRVGNTADHLSWLRGADWVVEAVAEDLAIKQALLQQIAAYVGPQAVVSSNTSGLSLAEMVRGCPKDFRRRFLGTHFFNPPRYMKPLELIPSAETDPAVFEGFARFADRVLGKRVIRAKDTPGFISTRLGMYALARTIQLAAERGLTVEEVDYLTGPLIGRPKSGTFRLADIIGIDITARIADNLKAALPHDAAYQALEIPGLVRQLIADGKSGAKSGAGFYRREKNGDILSLDLQTGEYGARIEPVRVPDDIAALPLGKHGHGRLRRLWEMGNSLYGGFLNEMLLRVLGYVANVTPEVAERIVEVDDALMGGFGWEGGPFHQLDALGPIHWPSGEPELVHHLHASGELWFYGNIAGEHRYFDFGPVTVRKTGEPEWNYVTFERRGHIVELTRPPDVIVLKDLRKAGKTVEETDRAALINIGDGVVCAEWRTKLGVLDPEVLAFLRAATQRAERDFRALVLVGAGDPFSAGFDLSWFPPRINAKDWAGIELAMRQVQEAVMGLKYAAVPVVCAVSGYTLGGGCEVMLHGAAVQAAFESYIGLPEANVGLIPVGGGVTEMLVRASAEVPPGTILERADPFPFLRPVWDTLRLAHYSSSADEARALSFLRDSDGVTLHPDRLLHDAKERALSLADAYRPPAAPVLSAMGEEGLARFGWEIHLLRRADQITEHDARIADRLAYILCGGELIHPAEITEQYVLDLEREAFLSLIATPETLSRINHLLQTGKPLRN